MDHDSRLQGNGAQGSANTLSQNDINAYHRQHPFTLPVEGDHIVSPITRTVYRIGAYRAQGSFGVVFECTDEWGHDLVAKVLRPIGDRLQTEEKALEEITAMALVRSPHIIHVHDAILYRGACYIISERYNLTLRQILSEPPRDGSERVFPILTKALLHALHFVHVQGLVHCDVHAGNVFLRFVPDPLDDNHKVAVFKLGDFGLARPITSMDPSGTFLNSLRPPESLDPSFGPLDHRSDVYQAGLLLLNFLSHKELTFTRAEMLEGRPRQVAEAWPGPVGVVIARMLRRHVDGRIPSAIDAWREFDLAFRQAN